MLEANGVRRRPQNRNEAWTSVMLPSQLPSSVLALRIHLPNRGQWVSIAARYGGAGDFSAETGYAECIALQCIKDAFACQFDGSAIHQANTIATCLGTTRPR